MFNRVVGAPLGGRVHWLLLYLSGNFKRDYNLYFRYSKHNYIFFRFVGLRRKLNDVFIVFRSSKRCFRLMYVNVPYDVYIYKSFSTSKECASFMDNIYNTYRKVVDYDAHKPFYYS